MLVSKITRIIPETDAYNPVILYRKPNYSHFIDSQNANVALFKWSNCTNLDIKDAACLPIVHILQHPTSHRTTKSTQTTMVNARKTNFSPLPVGKYCKWIKRSTQPRHQPNEGKSGLEIERVWALGALGSLRSNEKLAAKKHWETHILRNEDKEKWIKDYVERDTAVARKRVDDAETATRQEQEDRGTAENVGLTTREPEKTFEEMMVAIWDSLSNLASSGDGEDGEDEDDEGTEQSKLNNDGEDGEDEDDEETEQSKLNEDDVPSWVMGTISKTVQQRMERIRLNQMKLDE